MLKLKYTYKRKSKSLIDIFAKQTDKQEVIFCHTQQKVLWSYTDNNLLNTLIY